MPVIGGRWVKRPGAAERLQISRVRQGAYPRALGSERLLGTTRELLHLMYGEWRIGQRADWGKGGAWT